MLKADQIYRSHSFNLVSFGTPFVDGHTYSTAILHRAPLKKHSHRCISCTRNTIKAIISPLIGNSRTVKGVITVQPTISSTLADVTLNLGKVAADRVTDFLGRSFLLELVSAHLDSSGNQKEPVKAYARYDGLDHGSKLCKYRCEFQIPGEFGEIGAILVENEHHKEMYIKNIVLDDGKVTFTCDSWIQSKYDTSTKRIFFTNKSYLPCQTPEGVKHLREKDLESLQGKSKGQWKSFERVYDYDMYDDMGDPDPNSNLARPVLGGEKHPYPRHCSNGYEMTSTEPWSKLRASGSVPLYVPRDENFSDIKIVTTGATAVNSILHGVVPNLVSIMTKEDKGFSSFKDIDLLYDESVDTSPSANGFIEDLRRFIKGIGGSKTNVLQYEIPRTRARDPFSWLHDEEVCRQTLAGANPLSIQLVKEWPLTSKLDSKVYGPSESTITKEVIEHELRGSMTFEEAMEQKKLFVIDYHDLLLPYVNRVRELEGTTLYGSRMLMFLTSNGTLRPLAIELTRPPSNGKPQWKHVYTPCSDATGAWLWKLAKAHFLAHDSHHQVLISHWLRTHCVTEPYIIATNRHLSKMHPLHRLLSPHFRYTMLINGLARRALFNAGGIIESSFSLGKYVLELSSDVYTQQWRFDHEALPADLIRRGIAVEDQSAPHGLKLAIEDYPFANDGLLLWDCIKQWATAYIKHYYQKSELVEFDEELQAWWNEIRTVGHGDKKDEPWWPQLKTQEDLIGVVSTMMWVCSGHHSAVNFSQYDYAGYFPNRPTIARTKMPNEDPTKEEWQEFINNPKDVLLRCFPSRIQATKIMSTYDVLSAHSPDEEYIGVNANHAWEEEPVIKAAFLDFKRNIQDLESIIDSRNNDPNLRNRNGAGLVQYELFKPFSEPGVTGKGVPYSISI